MPPPSKSRAKRQATRLQEDNAKLADKFSLDTIAAVAGVSKHTVAAFRRGAVTRPGAAAQIAEALEKLKRGLTVADDPDGSYVLQSKGSWKGRTTVEAITRGKMCGLCGKHHEGSFEC